MTPNLLQRQPNGVTSDGSSTTARSAVRARSAIGARVAPITMVCFHAVGTAYCMPVEFTRSVRPAVGLVALPEPLPDIVGMLPGDPPLTVIAPLGGGGGHVLVVSARGTTFGLLVDAVTGLVTVPAGDVGPAPGGQHRALICGTVHAGGRLVMVADPMTMVEQL